MYVPLRVSWETDRGRQVAGVMMLGVGVWYLGFGTRWIAWYRGGEDGTETAKSGEHLITGVQVCFFMRRR